MRWAIASLLPLFVAVSAAGQTREITTNATQRYQTIDGWGTSASGAESVGNLSLWQQAFRDAGFNLLRLPLDAGVLSDFTTPNCCPADPNQTGCQHARIPLAEGSLAEDIAKFDLTSGRVSVFGQVAAWLKANALEPERVMITGSLWSPPHWMKEPTGVQQQWLGEPGQFFCTPWLTGDKVRNNPCKGFSIGGTLIQTAQNRAEYARYIAAWVEAFEQEYGVAFDIISLQNELLFENPFQSMTYSRGPGTCVDPGPGTPGPTGQYAQYANALKAVKDEWAADGLGVRIMGPHVDSIVRTGGVADPSRLNHQMEFIEAVKNHADPALIDFVDVYNSNGYLGSFYAQEDAAKTWAAYWNGKAAVPGSWPAAYELPGVKNDGKPVYMSETGGAAAAWLNGGGGTPGDGAITVAQRIFTAVVHGHVSTYVYWRLADASATEGPEELVGSSKLADPETSKKYSAFKHFSRFVRPGAQRIGATFDSNALASVGGASEYDTYDSLNVAAFLHQQDRTLTYVLVNMLPSTESLVIKMPAGLEVAQLDRYDTDQTASFQSSGSLAVAERKVSFSMPAYSVTTLTGAVIPSVALGPMAPTLLVPALGLAGGLALRRQRRELGGHRLINARERGADVGSSTHDS